MTNLNQQTTESSADYRIYVASLSDYNNGILHGVWIDCDGKDADDLQEEVDAMLRASKYPNVMVEDPDTGEDVPSAEEFAIHDHEGFGDLVGEYTSLSDVADIVEALEGADDPDALLAYASNLGENPQDCVDSFEDAYSGEWGSFKEFAEDYADQCLEIPEAIAMYFDYDAFARDLGFDYFTEDAAGGNVYVFRNV